MAEVEHEKSHGLKFAEQLLKRHGWEHGKGLGRAENGISEAIKVKVKCDKGGVGHKEGEQFTFHWWDHVFNKASSSLQVESDQSGITLKKAAQEDGEDGAISNKKPRKATLAKSKLYGCFVKSATLLSGQEQPEPKPSDSDDGGSSSDDDDNVVDDEEEDQKLDLSSTTKLSDADLMKACGGRTAHKGARHGLTMSAKLARLEQQEAEFMAKYGKKSQPARTPQAPPTPQSAEPEEPAEGHLPRKKIKKKKSGETVAGVNGEATAEAKPKKKKRKSEAGEDAEDKMDTAAHQEETALVESGELNRSEKVKRKRKKKEKVVEQNEEERAPSPVPDSQHPGRTAEPPAATKAKKKKKSSKHQSAPTEEEEGGHAEASQSFCDAVSKAPKRKAASDDPKEEGRKRCKRDKPAADDSADAQALPPPKKKKKKKSKE